ncbi:chaplin family protein [Stenotrophomonas sp. HITSZ_GD]|uniref:chaplin family protein n=1 Tax=Stenotrophomonas sp. HITSZ_GD TaxID=3037248 RepID=UPI00240D3DF4|nr:chaplin family protein [Stenotrophomonas sp. HITSZ_GD]MDG2524476.1 chaplin family protein [Stenotrophomonas sp. HITSZ_GD]
MESPTPRRTPQLLILVILLASAPCLADEFPKIPQAQDHGKPVGAGARQGVYASPGEMTLIRDVATRPAYRPAPPGVATIANPSPARDLARTLGTDDGFAELSDDDYAAMGSGAGLPGTHGAQGGTVTTVERMTGSAVTGTLGRVAGSDGLLSGNNLSQSINGPVGAVGNATRGIGDTVMGALSQFPLGAPAGTGHGPGN